MPHRNLDALNAAVDKLPVPAHIEQLGGTPMERTTLIVLLAILEELETLNGKTKSEAVDGNPAAAHNG